MSGSLQPTHAWGRITSDGTLLPWTTMTDLRQYELGCSSQGNPHSPCVLGCGSHWNRRDGGAAWNGSYTWWRPDCSEQRQCHAVLRNLVGGPGACGMAVGSRPRSGPDPLARTVRQHFPRRASASGCSTGKRPTSRTVPGPDRDGTAFTPGTARPSANSGEGCSLTSCRSSYCCGPVMGSAVCT